MNVCVCSCVCSCCQLVSALTVLKDETPDSLPQDRQEQTDGEREEKKSGGGAANQSETEERWRLNDRQQRSNRRTPENIQKTRTRKFQCCGLRPAFQSISLY